MSDSILSQIQEDKLCRKGTIKVRFFPSAKFDDFYHYAILLINKNPDQIILHREQTTLRTVRQRKWLAKHWD